MNPALWLPLFDDLADPLAVVRVAAEAEEAGWHGVFVWDDLRWRALDLVVGLSVGVDPAPFAKAGATWWLPEFAPEAVALDQMRGVLRDGPLTS